MRTSLTCLWLLCGWLALCDAELLFDKANEFAKDVQHGAKKVGDIGIFRRDERVASTETRQGDVTTTPEPRTIIGSVKRCAPNEVFAAGECRPTD